MNLVASDAPRVDIQARPIDDRIATDLIIRRCAGSRYVEEGAVHRGRWSLSLLCQLIGYNERPWSLTGCDCAFWLIRPCHRKHSRAPRRPRAPLAALQANKHHPICAE